MKFRNNNQGFTRTQILNFSEFFSLLKSKDNLNKKFVGGFTRTQNSTKSGFFNFFNNQKSKFKQNSSGRVNLVGGFTLVETLVAIAIFASSVTALISITARGINDNVFVKNKLIAGYLAQEGVELIIHMRDSAAVNPSPSAAGAWADFLSVDTGIGNCYSSNPVDSINFCTIDASTANPQAFSCINGECDPLQFDPNSGTYLYFGSPNSMFTRSISVVPVPETSSISSEVFVKSEVSWKQGSKIHTTSYDYNLFDWVSR